jgi:hypothetical protein
VVRSRGENNSQSGDERPCGGRWQAVILDPPTRSSRIDDAAAPRQGCWGSTEFVEPTRWGVGSFIRTRRGGDPLGSSSVRTALSSRRSRSDRCRRAKRGRCHGRHPPQPRSVCPRARPRLAPFQRPRSAV